jgi:N-acyl homoserine lactone hydrolase
MSDQISRRSMLKCAAIGAASLGALSIPSRLLANSEKLASERGPEVKAYAFVGGFFKTQTQFFLKDTRVGTPFTIPVTFFLVSHGSDWVAFDTGINGMVAKDPVTYLGEAWMKAYYPVMTKDDEFCVQAKKLGVSPKDLKAVILSHAHMDHAGAIDNFKGTDVPIYLQKKELDAVQQAVAAGKNTAYVPEDFKVIDQVNIKPINGVFDVFGDQTVVAFPTPGHTEGHQSLLVKQSDGKSLVLTADAMYTVENMREAIPPGLAWDFPQALQALYVFRAMSCTGAGVVPSHDPEYWKEKALAPKPFLA